jgi:transcriptional regulator with XRE-family HTH domain
MHGGGVAAKVREARVARGWSQFDLAVKSELHPATISLVERGTSARESTIRKIANALGVPTEHLQLSAVKAPAVSEELP